MQVQHRSLQRICAELARDFQVWLIAAKRRRDDLGHSEFGVLGAIANVLSGWHAE